MAGINYWKLLCSFGVQEMITMEDALRSGRIAKGQEYMHKTKNSICRITETSPNIYASHARGENDFLYTARLSFMINPAEYKKFILVIGNERRNKAK